MPWHPRLRCPPWRKPRHSRQRRRRWRRVNRGKRRRWRLRRGAQFVCCLERRRHAWHDGGYNSVAVCGARDAGRDRFCVRHDANHKRIEVGHGADEHRQPSVFFSDPAVVDAVGLTTAVPPAARTRPATTVWRRRLRQYQAQCRRQWRRRSAQDPGSRVCRRRGRPDGGHNCVAVGGAHDDGGKVVDAGHDSKNEYNVVAHGADEQRKPPVALCVPAVGALTAATPASPSAGRATVAMPGVAFVTLPATSATSPATAPTKSASRLSLWPSPPHLPRRRLQLRRLLRLARRRPRPLRRSSRCHPHAKRRRPWRRRAAKAVWRLERRRRGRRGRTHFCVALSGAHHAGDDRVGDGDVVNLKLNVVGNDADEVRKLPIVVCFAEAVRQRRRHLRRRQRRERRRRQPRLRWSRCHKRAQRRQLRDLRAAQAVGRLERRRRGRRGGGHFCVTLSGAHHAGDDCVGDGDVVDIELNVVDRDADEVRQPPVVVCVAASVRQRRPQLRRRLRRAQRRRQSRRRWSRCQKRAQCRQQRRRRRAQISAALSDAAAPETAAATTASPCLASTATARPRRRPSGPQPHVPRGGPRHQLEEQNDCCLSRRRCDRRDSSHLYVAIRGQHDDGVNRVEAGRFHEHQLELRPTTAEEPTNRTFRFCLAAGDATLTTMASPPTRWRAVCLFRRVSESASPTRADTRKRLRLRHRPLWRVTVITYLRHLRPESVSWGIALTLASLARRESEIAGQWEHVVPMTCFDWRPLIGQHACLHVWSLPSRLGLSVDARRVSPSGLLSLPRRRLTWSVPTPIFSWNRQSLMSPAPRPTSTMTTPMSHDALLAQWPTCSIQLRAARCVGSARR